MTIERQHGAKCKQTDQLSRIVRSAIVVMSAAIVSHSSQGTSAPSTTALGTSTACGALVVLALEKPKKRSKRQNLLKGAVLVLLLAVL